MKQICLVLFFLLMPVLSIAQTNQDSFARGREPNRDLEKSMDSLLSSKFTPTEPGISVLIYTTFEFFKESGKTIKLIVVQDRRSEWKKLK